MVFKEMEGGDQPSPKIGLKGTYGKNASLLLIRVAKITFSDLS